MSIDYPLDDGVAWKIIVVLVLFIVSIIGLVLYVAYEASQSCIEQGYVSEMGNYACYEINEETNTAHKLIRINDVWRRMG